MAHELSAVERVRDLFGSAIGERRYVRHEIVLVDGCFYLNPDNVLYPDYPPTRPFRLQEPDGRFVMKTHHLEAMADRLAEICPGRRVPLIVLSGWLTNYAKDLPGVE